MKRFAAHFVFPVYQPPFSKGIVETETGEKRGFNTMVYNEAEVDRIAKVAFEIAQKRHHRLCSVDKANVLDVSQLWRDRVNLLAKD